MDVVRFGVRDRERDASAHLEGFDDRWGEARDQARAVCLRCLYDKGMVDDVLQLVALRAWRGYSSFRGDCPFVGWVCAIARREAIRANRKMDAFRQHETSLDEGGDAGRPRHEVADLQPEECPMEQEGWLPIVVRSARGKGFLSQEESEVIQARLSNSEATWEELAYELGRSARDLAVVQCRAIPKLRVYLFVHELDLLGGLDRVTRAIESARSLSEQPLSEREEEVFRHFVLPASGQGCRMQGWKQHLRSACSKIIRHLPLAV